MTVATAVAPVPPPPVSVRVYVPSVRPAPAAPTPMAARPLPTVAVAPVLLLISAPLPPIPVPLMTIGSLIVPWPFRSRVAPEATVVLPTTADTPPKPRAVALPSRSVPTVAPVPIVVTPL